MIGLSVVLMVLGFVCFALAAMGVSHPRLNLQAAGLALWLLAMLVQVK